MKIGILTYHRTHNYGGCLQAVATRLYLESLGHRVYYVDYWPEYHKREYQNPNRNRLDAYSIKGKINYLIKTLYFLPSIKKREFNFYSFIDNYISPYCRPTDEPFDVIVYGSDQIWRKQNVLGWYNPVYFAENNFNADRHIAFSASMGKIPTDSKDYKWISERLAKFDKVAVREMNLKNVLEPYFEKGIACTVDPTLLISSFVWDKFLPLHKVAEDKYVLVYALWSDVFDMEEINKFAQHRGLKVITISGSAYRKQNKCINTTAGPSEFLSLVKNAEFVFTSSFHGLAFSIIYQKQFYASIKANAARVTSLLEKLHLINRFITSGGLIPMTPEEIDYVAVNKRLSILKEDSENFLRSI